MYKRAQELGVPPMAGSALPVVGTTPHLEHDDTQTKKHCLSATSTCTSTDSTRTGSTGSKFSSAWSSAAAEARQASQRCDAWRATPFGRRETWACGQGSLLRRPRHSSRPRGRGAWRITARPRRSFYSNTPTDSAPQPCCFRGICVVGGTPPVWAVRS